MPFAFYDSATHVLPRLLIHFQPTTKAKKKKKKKSNRTEILTMPDTFEDYPCVALEL